MFFFLFIFSFGFFFQAEDGIRDLVRSRGLGDVYKRQVDEAEDGAVALQRLQGGGFDFVVTDWNMPNMDGLQPVSYTHLTLPTSDLV